MPSKVGHRLLSTSSAKDRRRDPPKAGHQPAEGLYRARGSRPGERLRQDSPPGDQSRPVRSCWLPKPSTRRWFSVGRPGRLRARYIGRCVRVLDEDLSRWLRRGRSSEPGGTVGAG